MSNEEIKKPPLGLMPEWRHKELRLQEIREAVQRYIDANEPVPINWVAEEYALRGWLENREEEQKSKSVSQKDNIGTGEDGLQYTKGIFPTPNDSSASASKGDWEIVDYFREGLGVHKKLNEFCGVSDCKIHSVKRLSDGEVFTVGDVITTPFGLGQITKYELKSMYGEESVLKLHYWDNTNSCDNAMTSHGEFGWMKNIRKVTSLGNPMPPSSSPSQEPKEVAKEVLFVTEDGKEIREGDDVEIVNGAWATWSKYDISKDIYEDYKSHCKFFSNENSAQEYITMNKPIYCKKDLQEVWNARVETTDGIAWDQWRPLKYQSLEAFLNSKNKA